jgi:hypothetical protein
MFCAVPIRGLFAPAPATPRLASRKDAATHQMSMRTGKRLEIRRHFTMTIVVVGENKQSIGDRGRKNELPEQHPGKTEAFVF